MVHLVRHGEVENPHHVVYADLPGYRLSTAGAAQAEAVAEHLSELPVAAVATSPLLRARQTADAIAARHRLRPIIDPRLTEWAMSRRWAGVPWERLDEVFPGELSAYLTTPYDLGFPAELLAACAARVAAAARELASAVEAGHVVLVGHQDPIHAGHLDLVAAAPASYHEAKPEHGGVVTLEPSPGAWRYVGYWAPPQGRVFPPLP